MKYRPLQEILYSRDSAKKEADIEEYVRLAEMVGIRIRPSKIDGYYYVNPMWALWIANIFMRRYADTSWKFQLVSRVYNFFVLREPFLMKPPKVKEFYKRNKKETKID